MSYASTSSDVTSCPGGGGETLAGRVARHLLQWILPAPCLACGEVVWEVREALGLCPACRGRLVRWPRGCAVCGTAIAGRHPGGYRRPLGGIEGGYRCGACRKRPPVFERLLATWSYQPPLDQVMTALKFRRLDYLGPQLGRAVAKLHRGELDGNDLVVPVPLYWTRRLGRGFNQAELIARPVAGALGVPWTDALARRRPTRHQSRLGRRARGRNLDHAFAVRRPETCRGRRVLLVDDVTTTGATLAAAAAALRQAGAESVVALAAARTPKFGDVLYK